MKFCMHDKSTESALAAERRLEKARARAIHA